LGLGVVERGDGWAMLAVGAEHLLLCEPQLDPRGGVHVHYALSITPDSYEDWLARVEAVGPVHEVDFGGFRSLYVFDPDDHCVELATAAPANVEAEAGGTFEVVLEVRDLAQTEARYRALGATVTGRGEDRRRLRLDAGAIDLELWEPQLGIADGRGGLHVTMAGRTADLRGMEEAARSSMAEVEAIDPNEGLRRACAFGTRTGT
ncbi:MAG: fosmidomycin resistance protein, partial [Halobacteriales archaeon]|nr:fosmidomycin resistance protein [Halobacteriales archaeon]